MRLFYTQNHATATRKLVSPSFLTVFARSTRSSPTANLNLSHVAGLSRFQPLSFLPFIFLAANTASLSAKNTVKYLWDIAETRDLVCARTPSEELASACPEGLFDGEETLTLDERSFNLSVIYRWVDRVADVL
jgi:hypothetical protein